MPHAWAHNKPENPHLPIINSTKRQVLENLTFSIRSPTSKYILSLEIPSIPDVFLEVNVVLAEGIQFAL